jgi:hypothetical protein
MNFCTKETGHFSRILTPRPLNKDMSDNIFTDKKYLKVAILIT